MLRADGLTLVRYSAAMARIAPALPVSAKMYRHFAVITVVITVCIALFADGGTHASLASESIKAPDGKAIVERQANKVAARKSLLGGLHVKARGSGWGTDGGSGGDFGGGGGGVIPSGYVIETPSGTRLDPLTLHNTDGQGLPPVLPPGMSPEDYAMQNGKTPNHSKRVGAVKRLSEQELERIQQASRERTGSSDYAGN